MSFIGVISNPNSGRNRCCPQRLAELETAVGTFGIVRQTTSLAELDGVLAEFLDRGCDYWVCDGGDGTLHWVLTRGLALIETRRRVGADLAFPKILPANGGSIDFVAHKAGVVGQAPELVRRLRVSLEQQRPPAVVSLDTLRLVGRGADGQSFDHLGFATALGGIAQRFFDKLYERKPVDAWSICRVIGKSTAGAVVGQTPDFLSSLVPGPLRNAAGFAEEIFAPTHAQVEVDGHTLAFDSFASLQMGSIDISLGGVVRTFRHARTQGVIHAQAICSSAFGVVANLPNLVLGTPIWGKQVFDGPVTSLRVRALEADGLAPVIDGEQFAALTELEVTRGVPIEVPQLG